MCKVADCSGLIYAKGFCRPHYERYSHGRPLDTPLRSNFRKGEDRPPCRVEGCSLPSNSKTHGLCKPHGLRMLRGVPVEEMAPTIRRRSARSAVCAMPDCDAIGRDLCAGHQHLRYNFNLTPSQIREMFTDPTCAICGARPGQRSLHVDHDHACCPERGKSCGVCVRGLLCNGCNTGLGSFRDTPEILRKAADYLEMWAETVRSAS